MKFVDCRSQSLVETAMRRSFRVKGSVRYVFVVNLSGVGGGVHGIPWGDVTGPRAASALTQRPEVTQNFVERIAERQVLSHHSDRSRFIVKFVVCY